MVSDKNKDDLLFELKYILYLDEHGFPYSVPRPLPTSSNELYIEKNNRLYYCYNYIQGNTLSECGNKELQQIAEMIAIYHNILVNSNLENDHKISADTIGNK